MYCVSIPKPPRTPPLGGDRERLLDRLLDLNLLLRSGGDLDRLLLLLGGEKLRLRRDAGRSMGGGGGSPPPPPL